MQGGDHPGKMQQYRIHQIEQAQKKSRLPVVLLEGYTKGDADQENPDEIGQDGLQGQPAGERFEAKMPINEMLNGECGNGDGKELAGDNRNFIHFADFFSVLDKGQ